MNVIAKQKQIVSLLDSVQGSGQFVTSGSYKFIRPGLVIEGMGEMGFPVHPIMAKELIRLAKRAPFGRGSKTITDTTVRNAWEIDASMLSFDHTTWPSFLGRMVKKVRKNLGVKHKIKASLYKLLVYEEGGFFLPHQDSEKEAGMFGTLVIGLPSHYTGGELLVRFSNVEKEIDLAQQAGDSRITYAAFYADCEHEVKPVTAGYRINLVYNLILQDPSASAETPEYSTEIGEMTRLLADWKDHFQDQPKAILLSHQYTPTNFAFDRLKGHDLPRANVVLEAAQAAGYFCEPALVTHYQSGDGEPDYYYDRRRFVDDDVEMVEVHEEYSTVEHWSPTRVPALGQLSLDDQDIISDLKLGDGDPTEKVSGGYTGNEGVTVEYWYHYGALVLWPKEIHETVLANQWPEAQLDWIKYYLHHWDDPELNSKQLTRSVTRALSEWSTQASWRNLEKLNYDALAQAIMQINTPLTRHYEDFFSRVFVNISPKQWIELLTYFSPIGAFNDVIARAVSVPRPQAVLHLLEVLKVLQDDQGKTCQRILVHHLEELPSYLSEVRILDCPEDNGDWYELSLDADNDCVRIAQDIIKSTLALSGLKETKKRWIDKLYEALTKAWSRKYTNEVLHPILTAREWRDRQLFRMLLDACRSRMAERTKNKPQPPPTWKRDMPTDIPGYYKKEWRILRPFMESPHRSDFDYTKRLELRKDLENAIRNVEIDLKTETIRKGSPHTLRITKTMASYEKALAKWKEDTKLLKQLDF